VAYRIGHTLINDDAEFLDNDGNPIRDPIELRTERHLLAAMHRPGADFQSDLKLFGSYALPGIVVLPLLVRRGVRRLPAFLRQNK